MSSFDPFKMLYSVLGAAQDLLRNNFIAKKLRRSSRSKRSTGGSARKDGLSSFLSGLKKVFFIRWMISLFLVISVIPQYLDSRITTASRKSGKIKSLNDRFLLLYQVAFIEPARRLFQLLGMSFRWVRSRQWLGIIVAIIPTMVLTGAGFASWYGSRLNERGALAGWYHDLGTKEMEEWEASLGAGAGIQSMIQAVDASDSDSPQDAGGSMKVSSYAEMLFKRIQLLAPNHDSQIVIAATMMQRGAISSGQNILRRLAPDDRQNNPKAHAMMALSHLVQFMKTRDSSGLTVFEHHAEASLRWGGTPKEVLFMAGDLQWQRGNMQKALEMYQRAAAVAPEMNLFLYQRATVAGQPRLAELARERGITHLQQTLNRDPSRADVLAQLALLLATSEEGAQQAEELITRVQSFRPNPLLTRTLSEIYRMRFVNVARTDPNTAVGFIYLDKAMVIDPSNPSVAEFMEMMVRQASKVSDELQKALSDLLVSGRATTGTHAMLAEYHLLNKEESQALMHLEQVYQVAPSAVKYANHLATLYATRGELDKALTTASQTREFLQNSSRLNEKYSDDLIETVGKIYQKQQRYEEATEAYLQCLSVSPNRAGTRRLLAKLYQKQGDDKNAQLQERMADQIDSRGQELTAFQQALTPRTRPKEDADAQGLEVPEVPATAQSFEESDK